MTLNSRQIPHVAGHVHRRGWWDGRPLRPTGVELRRDEQLVAVDATRPDGSPDAGLVPVVLCGVDQAVPGSDGRDHGRLRLPVSHRRGAEPDAGIATPLASVTVGTPVIRFLDAWPPMLAGAGPLDRCRDRPGCLPDALVNLFDRGPTFGERNLRSTEPTRRGRGSGAAIDVADCAVASLSYGVIGIRSGAIA